MSSSNSPCAACKIQRRKCTQDCVFAPYFPPDNPQRFAYVHKVFGASNVAKILNDLNAAHHEDAVKSLAYEAEARLRDPVYGCVGLISVLQHRLKQLQAEVHSAKKELATYTEPHATLPIFQPPGAGAITQHHTRNPPSLSILPPNNIRPMMGIPTHGGQLVIHNPQQQQIFEAQTEQFAASVAAREQQEMMQQVLMRLNDGYNGPSASGSRFNWISSSAAMSPSFVLSPVSTHPCHINQTQQPHQQHYPLYHQLQGQLMLTTQQPKPQQSTLSHRQRNSECEVGRSIGPSC